MVPFGLPKSINIIIVGTYYMGVVCNWVASIGNSYSIDDPL